MHSSTNVSGKLFVAALIIFSGLFSYTQVTAQQADEQTQPGQQQDAIEADQFIQQASAKNLAEIETARLALENASSEEIKQYAQKIMEDHKKANQKLQEIARKNNIDLADDPALRDKVKVLILEQRAESFDEAYVNNQINAHQQAIDLFERAARSNDPAIREYAEQTLPKLRHHLEEARDLAQTVQLEEGNV